MPFPLSDQATTMTATTRHLLVARRSALVTTLGPDGLVIGPWLETSGQDDGPGTGAAQLVTTQLESLTGVEAALEQPVAQAAADVSPAIAVLAEAGSGYLGRPGIEGCRPDGSGWAPRFGQPKPVSSSERKLVTAALDPVAELSNTVTVETDESGLVSIEATITNEGDTDYALHGLHLTVPVADANREVMAFTGRWSNEFLPERFEWSSGTISVDNRRGRTSHDRFPAVFVGKPGFNEETGEVWAFHVAWSGNTTIRLETLADGRRSLSAGELLLPGEIVLEPGRSYTSPRLLMARSTEGLNGVSDVFHTHLRGRAQHPRSVRPIHLNTWEAVYFDHDLDTLTRLAQRAAAVGVERFVLDDGWFHSRRNDLAGLGDWWVDGDVWPDGLTPLVEVVKDLGMEFGLWVEPEMVNPDSDLFREHPEWALVPDHYSPVLARNQLVLDLTRPDVTDYLYGQLSQLLTDDDIAYLKWDMNRDLIQPSHGGRATVRAQVLALYGLLDRLRAEFPSVEIESCSSGGARIDAEILQRTHRFWTSDCNDALDRQRIQRGFSYLFPPELMGAHIGPPTSHTTGRTHRLDFRAGTALFGHFGFEWNLLDCNDDELDQLRTIVETHKRFRPLLHSGRVRRFDHPDPAIVAGAVIAEDRAEALVSVAQVATSRSMPLGPLRLTGLDRRRVYRVSVVPLAEARLAAARQQPSWVTDGVSVSGAVLADAGLQLPVMWPESVVVIHCRAADPSSTSASISNDNR